MERRRLKCFLFLWLSILIFGDGIQAEKITDDAIVIEAEDAESKLEPANRKARHIAAYGTSWSQALGEGNPCITSQGTLGACTSYRHCYPYFKLPEVGVWESWLLSSYDSCSYFNIQGRQSFGVCCTSPVTPALNPAETPENQPPMISEVESTTPGNIKDNKYQNWPPPVPTHPPSTQWPPPIPTHPPDHAAPTHPTRPPPTSWPPTTARPTPPPSWPPTTSRPPTSYPGWPPTTTRPPTPIWPPVAPTHPPTTPPPPSTGADYYPATCGAKNHFSDQERIVGGNMASPHEWPWMAVLFNNGNQFCGGSLLDSTHVLTAAHCIAHMTAWDIPRLKVHLGDYDIRTRGEVQHVERKVKQLIKHRGFDMRTLYYDVAIVTLSESVTFTKNIHPICLPSGQTSYIGQEAVVAGWGSLAENGQQPSILRNVKIPIWSNNECIRKYGPAAPGGIREFMICAGTANRDSCSGDSGGPLMVQEGSKWVQVGIVSWGIGCGKGQYPGVYSRVTAFMDWIAKNLKTRK